MPIYPSLRYHDPRAAIDWLVEAFGFTERVAYENDDGVVHHAELEGDGGMIMLGAEPSGGDPQLGPHAGQGWTYVGIAGDADARYAQAVAAGAHVLREPGDTDYGSRDFSVRDPEGNIWSFGTYAP